MTTIVRTLRSRDGHPERDGHHHQDGTPEANALDHAARAGIGDWMERHGPWKHYWDGSWHVSEGLDPNGRHVVSRTRFESADGIPFVPQQDLFALLEGDPS